MSIISKNRILLLPIIGMVVLFAGVQPLYAATPSSSNPPTTSSTNPPTTSSSNPPSTSSSNPPSESGTLQNPLKNISDLPTLLKVILQAVIELGSILLVIMLVWVGFLFVVARGNPEEISKARGALIWTLIGGIILLGAQAIMEVIKATVEGLG